MKPDEFFGVAELLRMMTGEVVEGRGRSAVSRYYYAALLEARDRLREEKGIVFRKHEMHDYVRKAYAWADPKRVKKVGRLLEDLKKLREAADYELDRTADPSAVDEAKSMSREILDDLAATDFDFSDCRDHSRPRPP